MTVSDLERFTEGDCWILAKRLHRITGWKLCGFPCDMFDETLLPTDHGFVISPEEKVLDIEGYRSKRAFCRAWGWKVSEITEFTRAQMCGHWFCENVFGDYSYQRARVVAEQLLDKYDLRGMVLV